MASATSVDVNRGEEIWKEYQRIHDVSDLKGRAAGINPATGEVFLGESAADIAQKRRQFGDHSLLYFVRIGYPTYLRKGRRPC